MKLHLPQPLPYEYVDELIMQTVDFATSELRTRDCTHRVIHRAKPRWHKRKRVGIPTSSNHVQPMFMIKNEGQPDYYYDQLVQNPDGTMSDPHGYVTGSRHWYSQPPMTEEQLDYYVKTDVILQDDYNHVTAPVTRPPSSREYNFTSRANEVERDIQRTLRVRRQSAVRRLQDHYNSLYEYTPSSPPPPVLDLGIWTTETSEERENGS